MAEQKKEMEAIANNPDPPTFENTFIPMEKSGPVAAPRHGGFLFGERCRYQSDAAKDPLGDSASTGCPC